jgi:hypothetical protein
MLLACCSFLIGRKRKPQPDASARPMPETRLLLMIFATTDATSDTVNQRARLRLGSTLNHLKAIAAEESQRSQVF